MNAIERAIRSAFEKGDPDDRAFRERVYRSAFAALTRSMEASPQLSPEDVARRRELFKKTIVQIEQEFVPALAAEEAASVEAAPSVASAVSSDFPPQPQAPELDIGALRPVPAGAEAHGEGGFPAAPPARERAVLEERRRPFALVFSVVTVLAVLVIGGWWVSQTLFGPRGGPVPSPPVVLEEEDFLPEPVPSGDAAADRAWITVFSPADITRVNAPAGMVAEVLEDESQPVLRIRSTGQGGTVALEIGQGALERAAGRGVMFAISARAQDGEETQISVSCDFGALGDCGRRRYLVGQQRGDFLFELDLPAARATGPGRIFVNPDIVDGSKALDLFEVRMSVSR